MTEGNDFSFGRFESERFRRYAGDFCRKLKIWIWVFRVDWPKSVDLRAISKWMILKLMREVTQDRCVEGKKRPNKRRFRGMSEAGRGWGASWGAVGETDEPEIVRQLPAEEWVMVPGSFEELSQVSIKGWTPLVLAVWVGWWRVTSGSFEWISKWELRHRRYSVKIQPPLLEVGLRRSR